MRANYQKPVVSMPAAPMQRPAANPLLSSLSSNNQPITSVGSVAKVPVGSIGGSNLRNFTLICDNSAGAAAVVYLIGDPDGVIAAADGGSFVKPDGGSISPDAIARTFAHAPVALRAINYGVTVSANQFNNPFKVAEADIDGSLKLKPIVVSAANRNNAFNDKLLTLDFGNDPLYLNWQMGFMLTVAAGEKVSLTMTVGAAVNRG